MEGSKLQSRERESSIKYTQKEIEREQEREKIRGRGEGVFHFVGANVANFARVCNSTSERVVTLPWTPAGHALTFQLSKLPLVFCKASTNYLYVFIFEGELLVYKKKNSRATSLQNY